MARQLFIESTPNRVFYSISWKCGLRFNPSIVQENPANNRKKMILFDPIKKIKLKKIPLSYSFVFTSRSRAPLSYRNPEDFSRWLAIEWVATMGLTPVEQYERRSTGHFAPGTVRISLSPVNCGERSRRRTPWPAQSDNGPINRHSIEAASFHHASANLSLSCSRPAIAEFRSTRDRMGQLFNIAFSNLIECSSSFCPLFHAECAEIRQCSQTAPWVTVLTILR